MTSLCSSRRGARSGRASSGLSVLQQPEEQDRGSDPTQIAESIERAADRGDPAKAKRQQRNCAQTTANRSETQGNASIHAVKFHDDPSLALAHRAMDRNDRGRDGRASGRRLGTKARGRVDALAPWVRWEPRSADWRQNRGDMREKPPAAEAVPKVASLR